MINSFKGRWFFLSNFYECKISYKGITYPSTEHCYVAQKINSDQLINGKLYPAHDVREMIANISTPGQVKRFGRTLSLRKDWDDVRLSVMEFCLREKFKYSELKEMLAKTGEEELVEGNTWHDNFFGSCSCVKCGNKGQNNLGKLLMKIRSEIIGSGKDVKVSGFVFPES